MSRKILIEKAAIDRLELDFTILLAKCKDEILRTEIIDIKNFFEENFKRNEADLNNSIKKIIYNAMMDAREQKKWAKNKELYYLYQNLKNGLISPDLAYEAYEVIEKD